MKTQRTTSIGCCTAARSDASGVGPHSASRSKKGERSSPLKVGRMTRFAITNQPAPSARVASPTARCLREIRMPRPISAITTGISSFVSIAAMMQAKYATHRFVSKKKKAHSNRLAVRATAWKSERTAPCSAGAIR